MFSANSSQVSDSKLFVEDVFSTYLYTGNGTAQTITNGIDLAGKGGLVWLKCRSRTQSHGLFDTERGENPYLSTDLSIAQYNAGNGVVYNSNGFTNKIDSFFGGAGDGVNLTYASWTFRKAPKFFDVVTWTGNGTTQLISHNLGVTPGFVIYKATSTTSDWFTFARNSDNTYSGLRLNVTNQADIVGLSASSAGLTSTTFNPNAIYGNTNGVQYVAYLYAHDAASDGIIQCGSTGGVSTVNLGWEPQWVMIKKTNSTSNWTIIDTMRGWTAAPGDQSWLYPNLSNAEFGPVQNYGGLTSTGFSLNFSSGDTYIYIAIRRGPMKTPTLGTSVYNAVVRTGTGGNADITSVGFPTDLVMSRDRQSADADFFQFFDRLRGPLLNIKSTQQTGENSAGSSLTSFASMNGFSVGADTEQNGINRSTSNYVYECFKRAPGFMDVVCYTGTGSGTVTFQHNLGVVPELIITKSRTAASSDWWTTFNMTASNFQITAINYGSTPDTYSYPGTGLASQPTASSVETRTFLNLAGSNVAYLFASCPGVSKVGSYTGNGSSQTINCGFAAGARFVMIKRTNANGDWYVWDTARGIVAGTDPHLSLNSVAAEVTSNDTIDTDSSGFVVNQVAATNVNVNAATYIYLAIA